MIKITKKQFNTLCRLSDFADYYLDDQEPSGEQYWIDREDITEAQELIREIEAQNLRGEK